MTGTYSLKAKQMGSGMMVMAGGMAPDSMLVATVQSGQATRADIVIPVGATLTVKVVAKGGGEGPNASVSLIRGKAVPKSGVELHKMDGANVRHAAAIVANGMNIPAAFDNVEPGDYTVCAQPLPSLEELGGGTAEIKIDGESLPVSCAPVAVTAEPEAQTATIEVEAMPTK